MSENIIYNAGETCTVPVSLSEGVWADQERQYTLQGLHLPKSNYQHSVRLIFEKRGRPNGGGRPKISGQNPGAVNGRESFLLPLSVEDKLSHKYIQSTVGGSAEERCYRLKHSHSALEIRNLCHAHRLGFPGNQRIGAFQIPQEASRRE